MISTTRIAGIVLVLIGTTLPAHAARTLTQLQVEYRHHPMGIDVAQPRFGWQIQATAGERGVVQTAFRLEVRNGAGQAVWDTGRTEGGQAVGIRYSGAPLQATTRYTWALTVWTQHGPPMTATSWFETGLMDSKPGSPAWAGAQWIGGSDDDLVLYAPYLAIFDLSYTITIAPGSTRGSFVFGANDSRLMDRFKNTYQIASPRNGSYIKLELDVSAVDGSPHGTARLNVYRVGYAPADDGTRPFQSFVLPSTLIDATNRHRAHAIGIQSAFGQITISVDGRTDLEPPAEPRDTAGGPTAGAGRPRSRASNTINLNPLGAGWDYLPFGMLCDIGFSAAPGQHVRFRDVTVRHTRKPGHVLFAEDLVSSSYTGIFSKDVGAGFQVGDGTYSLDGGAAGVFVVRDPSRNAMPMLRTSFRTASKRIVSGRLYVTARGIYEVHINGQRVGDDYYNPGLSQFNVTHYYQTYDVTRMLVNGANAMGAMLGEGWWSGLLSFGAIWNHFGDRQSILAKLVVTYADGTSETVTTNDRTWRYHGDGPIVYSSLDFGEVYDARRERAVRGWSTPGYDDTSWHRAIEVPLEGTTFSGDETGFGGTRTSLNFDRVSLVGQVGDTAGVYRRLSAKTVREVRPGVFVYDLGQNIVGVPRITIPNGRPGTTVTLRFAEMLYPDLPESGKNVGMIMTENYRAALSTDVYTLKAGPQVFQPRFTSHGFQYIEVTGLDRALPLTSVEGLAISSVRNVTADYRTSNPKVNQLWSNLVWSNVDNFLTVPTDCPQRNERMGWSGDINVFSRTATYLSNANQFLTRHLQAMRDVQGADGRFTDIAPVGGGFGGLLWGSAGIVVPWETYLQYDDRAVLEQHYPAMTAYINFLERSISPATGFSRDAMLGDWLGPQNDKLGSPFLATAYHAYDLGIMAKIATVLGKTDDAARFAALYERRRAFFNTTFVNADKRTVATGVSGFGGGPRSAQAGAEPVFRLADTQTSYAVGLGMGLFTDDLVPHVSTRLAESVTRENVDDAGVTRPAYSLMTGFIGTAWISKALSDAGYSDLAYRQLQTRTYPSWLYAVDQGATTIWERLNGYTIENGFGGNNSMNSFNHYSFGAVGQWMLAHSLGIQRGQPGFKSFVLKPEPDPTGGMTFAEGHYDSVYGRISSGWRLDGPALRYTAVVPPNTSATLYLPAASLEAITESGIEIRQAPGITVVGHEGSRAVLTLASGSYRFVVRR